MDVISLCPLRTGSLLWQPRPGAWTLTVVCKATFDLLPVESPLAATQEDPSEVDGHWDDDPGRSLYTPSDRVPFKPRADVILVGHAFTADRKPARSLVARLIVGSIDKSVEVFCHRAWTQDGALREGTRFTQMPLRYERAAGGPDTWNPVGMANDTVDTYGQVAVPNLQPPGMSLSSRADFITPIGFGPLAPGWPSRREKLGWRAGTFVHHGWENALLPEDIDAAYFNVAPPDQQTDEIRDGERIILEHLHPEHSRMVTSLEAAHPRAFVKRPGTPPEELAMKADTLLIDTDRAIGTVTWRGQVPVTGAAEPGEVLVSMERGGKRVSWSEMEQTRKARRKSAPPKAAPSFDPAPARQGPAATRPLFALRGATRRESESEIEITATGIDSVLAGNAPLPFVAATGAPAGKTPSAPPSPSPQAKRTMSVTQLINAGSGTEEFALTGNAAPADAAPEWVNPGGSSPHSQGNAGPAASVVPAPKPSEPAQPALVTGYTPSLVEPAVARYGAIAASNEAAVHPAPSGSGSSSPWAQPLPMVAPGAMDALAGSHAAAVKPPAPPAGAAAETDPAPARAAHAASQDVVELIWFEPGCIDRIRAHPPWAEILDAMDPPPKRLAFEEAPPPEVPAEVKARRGVYGVLTRARVIEPASLQAAIAEGVGDDGMFTPPQVVVTGELEFPFDEFETLKATVAAVAPLTSGDKKLKETVDTVQELLKTPWLEGSGDVAEGLTARIKEAWARGNRVMPAGYLEMHTERILLKQRHYQKRTVFGEVWIRALLLRGSDAPIPVYLPDDLTKKLPLFSRLKIRCLAEAHPQQDQYEAAPVTLCILALGRVVVGIRGK